MTRSRSRGFTLIEVVVAFVMLALILSTGFEIFSKGLRRAGELGARADAIALAQSQLALAATDSALKEGETRGETPDGRYRWVLGVTQTTEGIDPDHPVPSAFLLYRVAVHVAWSSGDGHDQGLDLATLQLGRKP